MDETKCLMNNKVGPYAFSKREKHTHSEREAYQNAFFVNPTTIQLMMKAFQPCSQNTGGEDVSDLSVYSEGTRKSLLKIFSKLKCLTISFVNKCILLFPEGLALAYFQKWNF